MGYFGPTNDRHKLWIRSNNFFKILHKESGKVVHEKGKGVHENNINDFLSLQQVHHFGPKIDVLPQLLICCKDFFLNFVQLKEPRGTWKLYWMVFPKKSGQVGYFQPENEAFSQLWICSIDFLKNFAQWKCQEVG